ncbi:1557_t:CDS:2 [Racocetra fulgida]|uniref:1557_t:CDS:1 n=1 Tax=Racocetra fulgida TaxID=60492 RepID=A0A9N9EDP6_9GLOM|nr:1557_t:CDS:2 [Racocetra fulgida]
MSIDEGSQNLLIFGKNSLVNLDIIIEENSESGIPDSTTSNLLSKHISEPTDKISKSHILKDLIKELSTKPEALQDSVIRKENTVNFNDLYNNIIYAETQNEIIN